MNKEAERVKASYVWRLGYGLHGIELAVEGKLSKNQLVQFDNWIVKIVDLNKNEDGLIEISGEHIDRWEVQSVYPYKENGEIKCWYTDRVDVLIREGRTYKEKLEDGVIKL